MKPVLQILVGLPLLYLAAVNLLLNTGALEALINQKPEKLLLSYEFAWSYWPGSVRIEGLRIRAQNPKVQWFISAEQARGNIDLLALPRKLFHADTVTGSGVTFLFRARQNAGDQGKKGARPDIPGLTNPPDPKPEDLYPFPQHPWNIRLTGLAITHLTEVWLEEYRFLGEARASANLDITPRRRLSVQNARLEVQSGRVVLDDAPVVQALKGVASFSIEPLNPLEQKGAEFFDYLTGRVSVMSDIKTLGFLNFYLRTTPWLSVTGGDGDLDADVRIRNGTITEGSNLEVRARNIAVKLKDYDVSGSGRVDVDVAIEEGIPMSTLGLEFNDFAVHRDGESSPMIRGEGLEFVARSPDLTLSDPFTTLTVEMRLPESEIPDTRVFNDYLPEKTGFAIDTGKGQIAGRFELSTANSSATGEVALAASDLHASYQDLKMRGDLKLEARFSCEDLEQSVCALSETRLEVDRVAMIDVDPGSGKDHIGWWGHVDVVKGELLLGKSPVLDVFLGVSVRDTGPLVSLFTGKKDLPGWLQEVITLEGIDGSAHLIVGKDVLDLEELTISDRGIEIRVRMRLTGTTRGILYASKGPFAIGLELNHSEKIWKLTGVRNWFEQHPPLTEEPVPAGAP